MIGSTWRKVKTALGLHTPCFYVRHNEDDEVEVPQVQQHRQRQRSPGRLSDAVLHRTTTSSSSGVYVTKSGPLSSYKKTCAICLNTMTPGRGHAIFTAECSHSFHFHCITSNVKYGNQICPVCRAKWKEVPFQSPSSDIVNGKPRMNAVGWSRDDSWMTAARPIAPPHLDTSRRHSSNHHEPAVFEDDEALNQEAASPSPSSDGNLVGKLEVKTFPEVSAVARSIHRDDFKVLVHIKAPLLKGRGADGLEHSRAPVDLVTVLDVSGSMAGTKLALLKRAMGFVIQNLGSSDRLSVIAFSSTARRLFPLHQMNENGRREALQAVNSLSANGGTNIAEGLKKGAKVIIDRRFKNPVASIILLSDGQDTYSISSPGSRPRKDYRSLLPISINQNGVSNIHVPVHTFGFGTDHDAASMHSIAEMSGGTFSFIEAEGVIQDAFAQCIGGLLSVVVQALQVKIECLDHRLCIGSIKAGSYKTNIAANRQTGSVEIGDLYAEEVRDFLIEINIPADSFSGSLPMLNVTYVYCDPITKGTVTLAPASQVSIERPDQLGNQQVSLEVDRQQNRIHAADAMAESRTAAEKGDLARAVAILDDCSKSLSESASAKAGDRLSISLCTELKEMQERMTNRQVYETSGRAYVLSGLSSHSWQRATARGDSTDSTTVLNAYQTPTMVDMLSRSQTMLLGSPTGNQRKLRQALSFPAARPRPAHRD